MTTQTWHADAELLATVDAVMRRRGYASRSEAVRDMIRDAGLVDRERLCVGIQGCLHPKGDGGQMLPVPEGDSRLQTGYKLKLPCAKA